MCRARLLSPDRLVLKHTVCDPDEDRHYKSSWASSAVIFRFTLPVYMANMDSDRPVLIHTITIDICIFTHSRVCGVIVDAYVPLFGSMSCTWLVLQH